MWNCAQFVGCPYRWEKVASGVPCISPPGSLMFPLWTPHCMLFPHTGSCRSHHFSFPWGPCPLPMLGLSLGVDLPCVLLPGLWVPSVGLSSWLLLLLCSQLLLTYLLWTFWMAHPGYLHLPLSAKYSVTGTLTHRAKTVCTGPELFQGEIKHLREALGRWRYPQTWQKYTRKVHPKGQTQHWQHSYIIHPRSRGELQ